MTQASPNVKDIYSGRTARMYDLHISHFFKSLKKKTFRDSSLKEGDSVLVFCCGTGLDFPYILKKIGPGGTIVGVDFSSEMLGKARDKVRRNNWANIELIEADVTQFHDRQNRKFDAGICTLGISIIPDYLPAYRALASHIKPGGEIIIGDMQLASGRLAFLNPLTLRMARKYGGTPEGHKNSLDLCALMQKELAAVKKKEFFFNSYFYCMGNTT